MEKEKIKRLEYLVEYLNKCCDEKLEQIIGLIENELRK